MAAQQCDALTDKHVVVIPSKSVPQGITALMSVDFDAADEQSITDAMTEALSSVTTAQITYAARDSDFDGFTIKEGDYLALEEGKLFGTDASLDVLLDKLASGAAEKGCTFITLYFGADVTEQDAQKAGIASGPSARTPRSPCSPAASPCTTISSPWSEPLGGCSPDSSKPQPQSCRVFRLVFAAGGRLQKASFREAPASVSAVQNAPGRR
jgi:hypothetical protein